MHFFLVLCELLFLYSDLSLKHECSEGLFLAFSYYRQAFQWLHFLLTLIATLLASLAWISSMTQWPTGHLQIHIPQVPQILYIIELNSSFSPNSALTYSQSQYYPIHPITQAKNKSFPSSPSQINHSVYGFNFLSIYWICAFLHSYWQP